MRISLAILKLLSFTFFAAFLLVGCRTEEEKFAKKIAGDYEVNHQCSSAEEEEMYAITITEIEEDQISIDNFGNLGQTVFVTIEKEQDSFEEYLYIVDDFYYTKDGEEFFADGFGRIYAFEGSPTTITMYYETGPSDAPPAGCVGMGISE